MLVKSLCGVQSSWLKQIVDLHSKNIGKWWGYSLRAPGAQLRGHASVFPIPASTVSNPFLPQDLSFLEEVDILPMPALGPSG